MRTRLAFAFTLAAFCLTGFELGAQNVLDGLPWRHIGPAVFGGRIDDIEAVASRPTTIFVGAAGGGLWRSLNNGVTWTPVFDRFGTSSSIGDVAIAPSDPNVVWVGTGEPNSRQSSTWGDGVYRSLDGGTTWTHMGLRDTHHIGRIVIHPRDPNTVFVAALGHLWGPNAERGLYRSRDAGRTWQRVLSVDENTGVVDVAMDPDGRTLYASTYQRRRAPHGFVGGGPGSGLWRSLDGGDTWDRLTAGLPSGTTGRIGLAIAPANSNIVYAIVEHRQGGVYRSDDRGGTWRRMNPVNPRPMYYSQIRVDPVNSDKVWVLGTNIHLSIDGGKTFTTAGTGERIHVDHHALWIDPNNPDHMMLGNDGGLHFTYDGAKHWAYINNLPIGQFYDVDVDEREPYWLYGGAQDNGSWGMPSRTTALAGIMNSDVVNLAYGDGFYATADLKNPRYVFANSQNGRAYRVDLVTREEQGVRPIPANPKETYRWNWNTPQLRSRHDPSVVYYAANKLFSTRDNGYTWKEVSPDLTRNLEWRKLPMMNNAPRDSTTLSRDDGIDAFGTITTLAESPQNAGTLLVGTDDGNVQMTTDGGATWKNISDRFRLAAPRWVSRVILSAHAGVGYVVFDGHNDDDMAPYVFRTTDGGNTWTSIAGDLPLGNPVKALAEHPRNRDLLFAGTEFGVYWTSNGGRTWQAVKSGVPAVRVDDVVYNAKTDDVVLATHGRSFIVLDDARVAESAAAAPLTLAPIRPAVQEYLKRMLPMPGAGAFAAPNPAEGALITYVVAAGGAPRDRGDTLVQLTISGADGKVVRTLTGSGSPGAHRVNWDLHYARVEGITDEDEGWFGPPRGPWVLPGTYTVKAAWRGSEQVQRVEVRSDARIEAGRAALEARHAAELKLQDLLRTFVSASRLWDGMNRERLRIEDAVKDRPASRDSLGTALATTKQRLDSLAGRFRPGFGGPKFRYLDLDGSLQAATAAPTESQGREINALTLQLSEDVATLNALLTGAFAELQQKARALGPGAELRPIVVP